jgi:hypothetical protein
MLQYWWAWVMQFEFQPFMQHSGAYEHTAATQGSQVGSRGGPIWQ